MIDADRVPVLGPTEVAVEENLKIVRSRASLVQFLSNPLAFFRSVTHHDASVSEIKLGAQKFYVLSDPQIIRDVLSTRGALFEKFPQGNPKQKLFGKGLLTSEGAAQKRQRRMLLPAFHRDRLQTYAGEMVRSIDRHTASWQSGQTVDIMQAMNAVTLEIIGRTLLDLPDQNLMTEIGQHLHTMLKLSDRFVVPWGDWLMNIPLPSTLRYRRAVSRLDEIVFGLIKCARGDNPANTLVDLMVESAHPDGTPLTDREIRDEIVTLIVAGHETVAVGLAWSLHLISLNLPLQDELAARVIGVLGDRTPTADDYSSLEFLQHAFAESMRLYPPIWILGRRSLEPYQFRNLAAPKGSVFLVCIADLHRNATFFTEPDSFVPNRWLKPDWPAYAYIPFGGGERRCIGERFAWMEAVLILASLLRTWRFERAGPKFPKTSAKLTLHPNGPVRLNLLKRSNPS